MSELNTGSWDMVNPATVLAAHPRCANGYIAVKPFRKDLEIKRERGARISSIAQKSELARSEVVYGTDEIPAGATVFMLGEANRNAEATVELEVESGRPFVLIPASYVRLWFPPGVVVR